ncbi:MAG: DUF6350 family protein [Candidatus Nanopelagicales bacterium]
MNRATGGREGDRIKQTRAGWAAPAAAVTTFWRSGPLPVPVAGLAAGLWAALTGLVITVVLSLVVWIFAAGESASNTAMRIGTDMWLVAHGTPFVVGSGVLSLLPWAWIVFPTATLWVAGRWIAHRAAIAYPKSAVVAAASAAVGYAVVALLAAIFGTVSGAAAMPGRALLHGGLLAFLVSLAAMAWRAKLGVAVLERAWRLIRPAAGALAVLTIGACVVLAGALVASHNSVSASLSELRPGLFGTAALLMGWLGYLPAALMWCLSYVTGPGVTVADTVVTPLAPLDSGIDLMGLQMLPVTAQPWLLVGLVIPIAAGVVLSRLAGTASSTREWLLTRAASLAVTLIVVDLWWAISVGRLGAGRLGLAGPAPAVIAVLMAGVVLGILLDVGGNWAWRRLRHRHVIDLTHDQADDVADLPA